MKCLLLEQIMDIVFFHLTMAHKFYVDSSNSLETVFVKKNGIHTKNVSHDRIDPSVRGRKRDVRAINAVHPVDSNSCTVISGL